MTRNDNDNDKDAVKMVGPKSDHASEETISMRASRQFFSCQHLAGLTGNLLAEIRVMPGVKPEDIDRATSMLSEGFTLMTAIAFNLGDKQPDSDSGTIQH